MSKLFIFLLVFTSAIVVGQETESKLSFGIKGGTNLSKYQWEFEMPDDQSNLYKFKNTIGVYVGGFAEITLSESLEFRPEVLFSLQGSSIDIRFSRLNIFDEGDTLLLQDIQGESLRETSLLVPLILKWNASELFYLKAGPQISYRLNLNSDFLNEPNDSFTRFTNNDKFGIQINLGAGYNLTEMLAVEAGYFFGLNYQDNLKISAFQLGIAYRL